MPKYDVVKPIEDPSSGKILNAGDSIELTVSQAKYPLLAGKIKAPASKPNSKPKKQED